MANFGEGYRYHVTGLTHDIRGFPTMRPDEIGPFITRLHRKISQHFDDIHRAEFFQTDDADIAVIAYGSVARSAKRAVREARGERGQGRFAQAGDDLAFPKGGHRKNPSRLKNGDRSRDEHGADLPGSETGEPGVARVLAHNKVDGTIITPEEILARILEVTPS